MGKQKILVPIDFSEQSKSALDYGTALAKDMGGELLIIHIRDPEIAYMEGIAPAQSYEAEAQALKEVRPTDPDVKFSHHMLEGHPAKTILDFSAENHVDMIVMGTHGRTGLRRLLMGSVAEAVVRSAPCPVLTLRTPTHNHIEKKEPVT